MRKKVDSRIRTLVENCVKLHQRAMFVVVGDKGRDQVVNLHYLLSKTLVAKRPSVLWCYKKELMLSSHKLKRQKQLKKMVQRGLLDPTKEDPFVMFVACTDIRYCYYHETHKILGNTFGMCVLQDFEALNSNLLARTMETVEGGGMVILLLSTLTSLTQLYNLTMDVHSRFRTESHQKVTGRFNERLVLSLASNPNCILMDDELNILPTSTLVKYILPIPTKADGTPLKDPRDAHSAELKELKESLKDAEPAGSLVARCRTLDQARAVVTFIDAASEKTLRSTVALTAARGRGKSAAMGIAISAAIALGYSNIFVTAPSPENLRTLFEFLFKGLDALEYKEHIDYDLVESTNPALGKAIIRVNVFRHHRQTVQYILPQHHAKLSQAELVVIDEAAAIPLPIVKALLGPYLVFLCSTVNGYEGTGRSLSLKLISQLREQGAKASGADAKEGALGRTLREVTLEQPIRYAPGDHVERWLNNLLCLDCADDVPKPPLRLPHPDECELFYVERDTLFSYHKASEVFLRRMVSLYVASHYKNQPNDLMLMSDAPAHHLFVLLGPVDETQNALPDILCVLQVALEGQISRKLVMSSMSHGSIPQGDLIPWIVGQQFQDSEFPRLSGARIVRIAVHPDLGRAGYGTKALELLCRYYEGEIVNVLDENDDGPSAVAADTDGPRQQNDRDQQQPENGGAGPGPGSQLLSEELKPRSGLPPLLVNLTDRRPEKLHYLGSSFGLTLPLFNFWRKCGYRPLYLRQTPSEVTGEHTIVVLKPLQSPDVEGTNWLEPFVVDFRKRFIALLGRNFRTMEPALALSILAPKLVFSEQESQEGITGGITVAGVDGGGLLPHDLKRLQSYSNNLVDHHMILDLVPALARAYFCGKLPATLSHGQAAILMGVGLQQLDITDVEKSLGLPSNQVLALFSKSVRKLYSYLLAAKEEGVGRELPKPKEIVLLPHDKDVEEELEEAGRQIQGAIRAQLQPEALREFAIEGGDEEFGDALSKDGLKAGKLVSIKKSVKASAGSAKEAGAHGGERKKGAKRKKLGGSGKGKKRRQ